LASGDINSLLKDKKGAYKESAAKIIAFAMFGEDLLKDLLEAAENRGESKANEDIVNRGKKEIQTSKSSQNAQDKMAAEAVQHLSFVQKKKDYL
jgi:vacuolar-type H+-ATPase subunit H